MPNQYTMHTFRRRDLLGMMGAASMSKAAGSQPPNIVYIMADGNSLIKIGITTNLPRRLAILATQSCRPDLRIAYSVEAGDGASYIERITMLRLARFRVIGEWFAIDVEAAIATLYTIACRALPPGALRPAKQRRHLPDVLPPDHRLAAALALTRTDTP